MGSIVSQESLQNEEFIRIGRCGQGTVYVVIGALSLRLEREAFIELSRRFGSAAAVLERCTDAGAMDSDAAFTVA